MVEHETGPLSLTIDAPYINRLKFGALWVYMDGLSRFMREEGYVECDFMLMVERRDGDDMLAWGWLTTVGIGGGGGAGRNGNRTVISR